MRNRNVLSLMRCRRRRVIRWRITGTPARGSRSRRRGLSMVCSAEEWRLESRTKPHVWRWLHESGLKSAAAREVRADHLVVRRVGADELIGDVTFVAGAADAVEERAEAFEVFAADHGGVGRYRVGTFGVFEDRRLRVGKREFSLIHHMKNGH